MADAPVDLRESDGVKPALPRARPIAFLTGAQAVSTTRYPQQDGLGNVIGLSTLTGVAEQVDYTPWGESTIAIGAALADTNRLQWKGLRWERIWEVHAFTLSPHYQRVFGACV